jgi:hypothetical protein
MGSYLQQYGIADERRGRTIKWIILICLAVVIIVCAAYLIFHNYSEKRIVRNFLAEINGHNYQAAYRDWGCTAQHPCPNYDYSRFLQDWGPSKKVESSWKISSVDGCKTFVTVNVQAQGSELQSLAVERNDQSLGFAPSPECQERQWRWKQFFQRIFGGGRS